MRALCAALPLLLGCSFDFERPSVVNSLRILTVRADPAAVLPGESTVLTPLVADPLESSRGVRYEWGECVTFDGTTLDLRLPSDCAKDEALPVQSDQPTFTYTVPAEVAELTGIEEFTGQSGSFGIPVRLIVRAGNEEQIAIVPVSVALVGEPNRNPTFEALLEGGEDWPEGLEKTLTERSPLRLQASWPESASEEYTYVTRGAADTEQVVTTREVIAVNWYSSVGELDPDVTSEGYLNTKLELGGRPPGGVDARLWIVLSDGRGGVDYLERPVRVP